MSIDKTSTRAPRNPTPRTEHAPTHRCTICGAFWRLYTLRDTTSYADGTWNLRSAAAGPCCDNTMMAGQIAPATIEDMREYVEALAPATKTS